MYNYDLLLKYYFPLFFGLSSLIIFIKWQLEKRKLRLFKVGYPCTQYWKDLKGDDKSKYCDLCELKVHNVCRSSKSERNELLSKMKRGERVCVYIEPSLARKGVYIAIAVVCAVFVNLNKNEIALKLFGGPQNGMIGATVLDESKFTNLIDP